MDWTHLCAAWAGSMDQKYTKPSIGSYGRNLMDDCIYVLSSYTREISHWYWTVMTASVSDLEVEENPTTDTERKAQVARTCDQIRRDSARATPSRTSTEKAMNAMPSHGHPTSEQRRPEKHN